MASETITLTSICSGGNHLTFTLTGAKDATVEMILSEVTDEVTQEDLVACCKCIAKFIKIGRTLNQARTVLQNGVTVGS